MVVIIPAYQPDIRLIKLVQEIIAKSDYSIIVINDGSAKECMPIFDEVAALGCIVLSHEMNKGKGAALKTAFSYALTKYSDEGFICADCDGQHTWNDIKKIAEEIPLHPSSIILGSRNFIGTVPFRSMIGNKITRFVYSIITGNKISDTQTGLRGFTSRMLPWLVNIKGNHYEYEMHQLLEAKSAGFDFYCVPIDTIYENNNESSHFHPVRDSIRIFLPIAKFSLSSISCGFIDFVLLFVFHRLTNNLLVSVISARIISSLCNYLLNKNIVFKSTSERTFKAFFQYYLLAVFILACNYLLLSLFNHTIGLSLFISKLLTEGILFFFSFFIQHKLIFKNQQHCENVS